MQTSPNRFALFLGALLICAAPAVGDPITVEEIFQFSVNGADMDGSLLITAVFDDGFTQQAGWGATNTTDGGAAGMGWSLSVADADPMCAASDCADTQPIGNQSNRDIAFARGVWTLVNSRDANLESLTLTGLDASDTEMTIFDRFYRLVPPFNGPNPGNPVDDTGTDGSAVGWDFTATDAPPGVAVTASYDNPISLLGGPAPIITPGVTQQDVYATVILDFSGDPFGPRSTLQFVLDTDLATPLPDPPVPEPSTLLLVGLGGMFLAAHRRRNR